MNRWWDHDAIASEVGRMPTLLEELLSSPPRVRTELPSTKVCGVYLFTENGNHLYVGRTDNIRGRHGRHCLPGATKSQASFAFKLAREATNNIERRYKPGSGTRKDLMAKEEFRDAFQAAKARIQKMEFRYITVEDPGVQYLLEFYVSHVLKTPYNHFDNH